MNYDSSNKCEVCGSSEVIQRLQTKEYRSRYRKNDTDKSIVGRCLKHVADTKYIKSEYSLFEKIIK